MSQTHQQHPIKYYLSDFEKPCRVIIYNHNKYDIPNVKEREGSDRDLNALESELKTLEFEVIKHDDMTFAQIQETQKEYTICNYEKFGGIMVVVLTHGLKGGYLLAKDRAYHISHLWKDFINVPSLRDKPKIFIIQACRSDELSTPELQINLITADEPQQLSTLIVPATDADPTLDEEDEEPEASQPRTPHIPCHNSTLIHLPFHQDFLVAWCTVEGRVAQRGLFIPHLCDQLRDWPSEAIDLLSLLTRTNKMMIRTFKIPIQQAQTVNNHASAVVANNTVTMVTNGTQDEALLCSQTATFTSFLRKTVYYSRTLKEKSTNPLVNCTIQHQQPSSGDLVDADIQADSGLARAAPEEITAYRWDYKYRGRALIYHDVAHKTMAEELAKVITEYHLTPILSIVDSQETYLKKLKLDCDSDFKDEGCLVVCLLCTMEEQGLIYTLPETKSLLLTSLRPTLAAKPKIIIFAQNKEISEPEVVSDGEKRYLEEANDHSDCLCIVGHNKEYVSTLIKELQSGRGQDLYEILTRVMSISSSSTSPIPAPYFESTLQLQLAFSGEPEIISLAEIDARRNVDSRPDGFIFNFSDTTPSFNERQDELEKLNKKYENNNNKLIGVSGDQDVGKTELVYKFITQHGEEFKNKIVIDINDSETILETLILKCHVKSINEIYKFLKEIGKTIIFFDNIQNLEDLNKFELPIADADFCFIAASRNKEIKDDCLILKGLTENDAVQYLKERINLSDCQELKEQELNEVLIQLAQSVQCLPGKLKKLCELIKDEISNYLVMLMDDSIGGYDLKSFLITHPNI